MLLHPITKRPLKQQELKLEEHQMVIGKIISGDIGALQDGTIIEPITAHKTEPEANEARERAQKDDPGRDYRVVISTVVS